MMFSASDVLNRLASFTNFTYSAVFVFIPSKKGQTSHVGELSTFFMRGGSSLKKNSKQGVSSRLGLASEVYGMEPFDGSSSLQLLNALQFGRQMVFEGQNLIQNLMSTPVIGALHNSISEAAPKGLESLPILSEVQFTSPILTNTQVEDLGITIAQYHLTPNDVEFSPLPTHTITWNIGEPGDLVKLEGKHSRRVWMDRGGMTLTPAGQLRHWCWDHTTDVLLLQLPPQFISQIAIASEIDINQIELANRFGIYDPQMEWLGKSLLAEMQSNGLAGRLYTESLLSLLVIHLLRQHSVFGQSFQNDIRRIAPSRLKRVLEYIHDNLGQNLSLANLANFANLSTSRFTRVFRQETGLSPHQYLIQARIEQAKHLLRSGSELSIGDIAHQVGFADQSHFTRHFKRIVGVTPKVVLQESRNIPNYSPNIQDRDT